jgi:hypothetical protein
MIITPRGPGSRTGQYTALNLAILVIRRDRDRAGRSAGASLGEPCDADVI